MKHPATHPIIKQHFEKIDTAFSKAVVHFTAEDIHTFRVEIKKLRAFLRLIDETRRLRLPRRLHKFYRMVGNIRNLELQQQRIREVFAHQPEFPQTYLNLLGTEVAAATIVTADYARRKLSIRNAEKMILEEAPVVLVKRSLEHFIHDAELRLETFTAIPWNVDDIQVNNMPVNDNSLHDLRKCLKDLQYNYSYISKAAADRLPEKLIAGKEKMRNLTEALGRYQDLYSGLSLLSPPYMEQIKEEKDKALLDTLRQQWEKDKLSAAIDLHAQFILLLVGRGTLIKDSVVSPKIIQL